MLVLLLVLGAIGHFFGEETVADNAVNTPQEATDTTTSTATMTLEERIKLAGEAMAIDPDDKEDPEQVARERAEYMQNKQWLRDEVSSLLAKLDTFRTSQIFKQCIYGCGKDNPGNAWNLKIKALQEQMTPQLNAPILLKVALSDLWSLGMAYGKGKENEAREWRSQIEEALRE